MNIRVFSPAVLDEALNCLQQPEGQVLAGGTDLIIELRKEKRKPQYIVDISNIKELKSIELGEEKIRLGAMVTFADIINNEYIKNSIPSLWEAAYNMGACQIQNKATIGGNICNAAPAADSIPVFLSLAAQCEIKSASGSRLVPVSEVVLGSGKNCLKADELLTAVIFDIPRTNEVFAFSKLGKRNALAISTISCAVRIYCIDGIIKEADICTGSLGSKAEREYNIQSYMLNKKMGTLDINEAADILSAEVEERLKARSSITYKKAAVKGVIKEALQKCINRYHEVQCKGCESNE